MYQKDWDKKLKKTNSRLALMSKTVSFVAVFLVSALLAWAGMGAVLAFISTGGLTDESRAMVIFNTVIALLGTMVIAVLFNYAQDAMRKIRWRAGERLGDRPRVDDHKADDYEMLQVSSFRTSDGKFIAMVNDWQFLVTRRLDRTKDGKHTLEFAFDELGPLSGETSRMAFGTSSSMDEGTEIAQDEVICMALSKIAHQYPALQSSPPAERYTD
jgi:hypothetical protein